MDMQLTPATAKLELMILDAESETMTSGDFYAELRSAGLPPEAAVRLKQLANATARIGEKVINIGRVVLAKLIEFIKAHPNLSAGIALGLCISLLVSAIPLLGHLLAPLALVLGVSVGAAVGNRMDRAEALEGQLPNGLSATENAIDAARKFFALLIAMLQSLSRELSLEGAATK